MTEPASTTAGAVTLGIKSGVLVALFAFVASIVGVVVGFTIFPPLKGRELQDIARRLAAGLFCSFTLGPLLALKVMEWWPWYLQQVQAMLPGMHPLWPYVACSAPFIAITGIPGFWIVAALMRWFAKRSGKDLGELARDAVSDARGAVGGQ